jgi:hypothetical protein
MVLSLKTKKKVLIGIVMIEMIYGCCLLLRVV